MTTYVKADEKKKKRSIALTLSWALEADGKAQADQTSTTLFCYMFVTTQG
jgi:hypothetical protein